jgi:hypothetical protein
MSTESEKSMVMIQLRVMMIAHLNVFRTLKIGLTGMETLKIQLTAKTIASQILNLMQSKSIALRIRIAQSSRI